MFAPYAGYDYQCDYMSYAKHKCLFENIKSKCSDPVHDLMCNKHLEMLFGLTISSNRIKWYGSGRTVRYLTPTRHEASIPFPFEVNGDNNLCKLKDDQIKNSLDVTIARMDANVCDSRTIFAILHAALLDITGPIDDDQSMLSTLTKFKARFSGELIRRFGRTRILAKRTVNGERRDVYLPIDQLPTFILWILFYTETNAMVVSRTNNFDDANNEIITLPYNLLVDLDERRIRLVYTQETELIRPLLMYSLEEGTNYSTVLILRGSSLDTSEQRHSRVLVPETYKTNSVPYCSGAN